jgi:plasmid stabilization system protein ParE
MTRRYDVLPAADRDQAAYLATEASLEVALRFYDAASSTFSRVADMPGMGEQWESTDPRRQAIDRAGTTSATSDDKRLPRSVRIARRP